MDRKEVLTLLQASMDYICRQLLSEVVVEGKKNLLLDMQNLWHGCRTKEKLILIMLHKLLLMFYGIELNGLLKQNKHLEKMIEKIL